MFFLKANMRRHAWNCDLSTKPGTDILTNRHIHTRYFILRSTWWISKNIKFPNADRRAPWRRRRPSWEGQSPEVRPDQALSASGPRRCEIERKPWFFSMVFPWFFGVNLCVVSNPCVVFSMFGWIKTYGIIRWGGENTASYQLSAIWCSYDCIVVPLVIWWILV